MVLDEMQSVKTISAETTQREYGQLVPNFQAMLDLMRVPEGVSRPHVETVGYWSTWDEFFADPRYESFANNPQAVIMIDGGECNQNVVIEGVLAMGSAKIGKEGHVHARHALLTTRAVYVGPYESDALTWDAVWHARRMIGSFGAQIFQEAFTATRAISQGETPTVKPIIIHR